MVAEFPYMASSNPGDRKLKQLTYRDSKNCWYIFCAFEVLGCYKRNQC